MPNARLKTEPPQVASPPIPSAVAGAAGLPGTLGAFGERHGIDN